MMSDWSGSDDCGIVAGGVMGGGGGEEGDWEGELMRLERAAASCLLRESTHQLAIMQTGARPMSPVSPTLLCRPIMERINDCASCKIFNKETWELTEVAYKLLEEDTLNKIRVTGANYKYTPVFQCCNLPDSLVVFRQFIQSVLETLRSEILSSGTMLSIQRILQLEHEYRNEGNRLIKENIKYKKKVASLKNQINEICSLSGNELNEKEIQLAKLQDEVQDLQYHKEVSLVLTEQRVAAKLSQVSLWLTDHEQSLVRNIEFNTTTCELQDRVHVEILNYLDCVIQDLKEQLEYWTQRLAREIIEMNFKLDELQQARHEQSIQFQALDSLFKKHNKEMNSYVEERTARVRRQQMQKQISEMATKIQAWWRGTMVRRHLGPYKVDKKKKPKDKPKKKK